MNKKKLIYIILKFIPFILGVSLYSVGIVNLASSLLLFLGGYVTVKNLFDYRLVKKNIASIFEDRNHLSNQETVMDEDSLGNDDTNQEKLIQGDDRVVEDELEKGEQKINAYQYKGDNYANSGNTGNLENSGERGIGRKRYRSKKRDKT